MLTEADAYSFLRRSCTRGAQGRNAGGAALGEMIAAPSRLLFVGHLRGTTRRGTVAALLR